MGGKCSYLDSAMLYLVLSTIFLMNSSYRLDRAKSDPINSPPFLSPVRGVFALSVRGGVGVVRTHARMSIYNSFFLSCFFLKYFPFCADLYLDNRILFRIVETYVDIDMWIWIWIWIWM